MCFASSSLVMPNRAILAEVRPVRLSQWDTPPVGTSVTQSSPICMQLNWFNTKWLHSWLELRSYLGDIAVLHPAV